jgi:hypothetical protein
LTFAFQNPILRVLMSQGYQGRALRPTASAAPGPVPRQGWPQRRSSRLRVGCAALVAALALGLVPATASAEALITAAGDIACDPDNAYFNRGFGRSGLCQQRATRRLLRDADTVLPLDELQYEHVTLSNFRASYTAAGAITGAAPGR